MQPYDALERLPSRAVGRSIFASRRNGAISTLYARAKVGAQLVWLRLRLRARGAPLVLPEALSRLDDAREEVEAWAEATLARGASLLGRDTATLPEFPPRPFDALFLRPLKQAVLGALTQALKQHDSTVCAALGGNAMDRLREELDFEFANLPARRMRRELVLFAGPPNSGKTFEAMRELVASDSGAYLGPLRLLAMEAQETAETAGRPCSLITGEEALLRPGARLVASTVELANLRAPIDCAVIDEAQLMADPDRGWAFVQALVGVPARRVLITGSLEAVPLVQHVAQYLNEPLQVEYTHRKGELRCTEPLGSLSRARAGDAFIAFSRRGVMAVRTQLRALGFSPAVVYGALSPEVRRAEARAFRTGRADVLVATDAIGLGLNLPVARVVFTEVEKFDSVSRRELRAVEAWQIANRAGRYGVLEQGARGYGEACAVSPEDHVRLSRLLEAGQGGGQSGRVRFRPSYIQAHELHRSTGWPLSTVLAAFQLAVAEHPLYEPADIRDSLWVARHAALAGLSFDAQFAYTCAPIDRSDRALSPLLVEWMTRHATGASVFIQPFGGEELLTDSRLREAEDKVRELALYHWAARHFPSIFPDGQAADAERQRLNSAIARALARTSSPPVSGAPGLRARDWLASCLVLESVK